MKNGKFNAEIFGVIAETTDKFKYMEILTLGKKFNDLFKISKNFRETSENTYTANKNMSIGNNNDNNTNKIAVLI